MGDFDKAVRQLREAELRCFRCQAVNKPHAKPTIELDAHNHAACNQCGHSWIPSKE